MQLTAPRRRILIIDDNDAIQKDFQKILCGNERDSDLSDAKLALFGEEETPAQQQQIAFELEYATQGQDGLRKIEEAIKAGNPFSVAFVDMRMPPGWDGLRTIEKLWEADPDLQVTICSAYSDSSWEEISSKLGLTDRLLILKKPFDPAEVVQIAAALSEKWLLRRAARLKMEELEQMVQIRTAELTYLAMHDKLTSLPNRAMLMERLAKVVNRSVRDANYGFTLLFLDFDRFKIINDTLGHDAGDLLLKEIASRLTTSATLSGAAQDTMAARLGGDEFVVLIERATVQDATRCAEQLLHVLGAPYYLNGRDVHSTASIGITTSAMGYTLAADALRDADIAMYHAKAAGKARWVFFDRPMHEALKARLELEVDLRRAMEHGELLMHYQPIIDLRTGQLHGFEALVRWNHPRRGLLMPADFLPCCEEIGLIVPIGAWVLQQACIQQRKWSNEFPDAPLSISVNVSACQLASLDMVRDIRRILEQTGMNPKLLTLEITESVVIIDAIETASTLREIRELGIRIHMDDFGTGYSSLSCLHQLPLNGLKMDRKFILNMDKRRDYAAVVHAIVNVARNLNLTLIAEGIETSDQVAMLQAMDCDLAQGFYFKPPMDATAASEFIARGKRWSSAA